MSFKETSLPTLYVGLEVFPPLKNNLYEGNIVENISAYLRDIIHEQLAGRWLEASLSLPSVTELTMFLYCHEFDVYEAINKLRREGYEIEMEDFYSPIRVNRVPQNSFFRSLTTFMAGLGSFLPAGNDRASA